MRYLLACAVICSFACIHSAGPVRACGLPVDKEVATIVSGDEEAREKVISQLREQGPRAVVALINHYRRLEAQTPADQRTPTAQAELARLKGAIDLVGGQRDCAASLLYWYTDFDKAKAAARKLHKPILALRMLGKLTDEFSCANSRFFRTTLYANKDVSQHLRNNFVLHWESVRPVPRVTIDFGDGRKLERTVTGNSVHYVLDGEGRVIDALPGLYGPTAFLRGLSTALQIHDALVKGAPGARDKLLIDYHRQRIAAIDAAWQNDVRQLRQPAVRPAKSYSTKLVKGAGQSVSSDAVKASAIAAPKALAELPLITALETTSLADPNIADNEQLWKRVAQLHASDAVLDGASINLMRSQAPSARRAGKAAITKKRVEDPLVRMVRNFQVAIALDTVRNEYVLHRQIHAWFVAGTASEAVNALNERVYAELFLTPSSDPWLGLVPKDTYTALENDGRVVAAAN